AEPKEKEEEVVEEEEVVVLEEDLEPFDDGNPWYYDIENFCRDGSFPDYATVDDRKALRRIALRYRIEAGVLHRKAFSRLLLRCVPDDQCMRIMEESHSGECSGHFSGQTLAKKILMLCYWPTLEADCAEFVRRCVKCQIHANKIHAPSSSLLPVSTP